MKYIEFPNLEKLAEYIGLRYPEEIHTIAHAEGFYTRDVCGDWVLCKEGINDYLARYGADIRVENLFPGCILCAQQTAEADETAENMDRTREYRKRIAEELETIAEELETIAAGQAVNEDGEEMSLYDYINDALDFEYTIDSRRQYKAAKIWVSLGGPNIWIDTAEKAVKLAWGADRAEYPISYDTADALDDIMAELWEVC